MPRSRSWRTASPSEACWSMVATSDPFDVRIVSTFIALPSERERPILTLGVYPTAVVREPNARRPSHSSGS